MSSPRWFARPDDDVLLQRAFRAYFRWGGPTAPQPSNTSCIEVRGGIVYVVLMPGCGPLPVVYRLDPAGVLRRLKGRPKWAAEMAGIIP